MSAYGLKLLDSPGCCCPTDISGQTVDISGQTVDISGQAVIVDISGQTVDISGQAVIVDISGQTVDISGQTIIVDISGQTVDISGQTVDISGQTVIVDISGQTVDISGQAVIVDISGQTVDISGQTVDISGQTVIVDISGQTVDISGQTIIVDISGQTVDISGQTIIVDISGQTVDISGQTVDISGQTVIVDISGQTVDISGQTVDISGQTVIVDISGQTVDISGQMVDISGQTVDISGQTVIADISGQTVDISGQTVDISGQTVITNISGQTVHAELNLANATGDAFGRLRVSNPFTLFEFNSILGKGNDSSQGQVLIDERIVGATSTSIHYPAEAYIEMLVTTMGGSVIRQSHEYIPYQPGKSKLVYMTGVLHSEDTSSNGITTRIGAFDSSMGFFIQYLNGNYYAGKRELSGTITDISRTIWTDPLDGTGACPINVNFTKAQIYVFDFEWLGVGQVRCGIVIGGILYYYYTFTHINELVSPYTLTAKLPLRYSIQSTLAGAAGKMRMLCGTVISEGGFNPFGSRFLLSNGITPYSVTSTTFESVLSLRLRTTSPHKYATIKIKNIDIFSLGTKSGIWQLILNPTLSGATFTQYDTSGSVAEVCVHPSNQYTAGTGRILYQDYYTGKTNSRLFTSTDELIAAPPITVGLLGTSDVVTLVVNNLETASANSVFAMLEWIEIL